MELPNGYKVYPKGFIAAGFCLGLGWHGTSFIFYMLREMMHQW